MGGLVHVGGWHGLEYIGSQRRLLIFEPQREAFAQLQINLGDVENVELVNVALGAAEGRAVMHTSHPSHSSSLLECRQGDSGITFSGTETVAMQTLDHVMDGRSGYDELRIDTQGYELEVLRGATETLKHVRRVEVEVHDPHTYAGAGSIEEIDDLLVPLGFSRTVTTLPGLDDLADVVYERNGRIPTEGHSLPKRYKVVGTQPVLGHQPGATFEATIEPGQEGFLIQIGGLKVLEPKRDKK